MAWGVRIPVADMDTVDQPKRFQDNALRPTDMEGCTTLLAQHWQLHLADKLALMMRSDLILKEFAEVREAVNSREILHSSISSSMDINGIIDSFRLAAGDPFKQGFAGFDLARQLMSFAGDVNNNNMRALMKDLNMPPVAATQLGLQIGEVLANAKAASSKLDQMIALTQIVSPATRNKTVESLVLAMSTVVTAMQLLETADFTSEDTVDKLSAALATCEQAFARTRDVADDGLKLISGVHAQILELHAMRLNPMDQKMDIIRSSFGADLTRSTERFRAAKNQAQHEADAAKSLRESCEALQRKVNENRQASETSDTATRVVFGILSLGITEAVHAEPPDWANLKGELRDAENRLREAQNMQKHASDVKTVAEFQMGQVRDQLMFLASLQGDLPKVVAHLDHAKDASIAVQRQFADMKDRASQLVRQIAAARSTAANTRDLAILQKEFADGLLVICEQSLVDGKLIPMVKAVIDIADHGFKLVDVGKETRKRISSLIDGVEKSALSLDAYDRSRIGPLGIPVATRALSGLVIKDLLSVKLDSFPTGPLGLPSVVRAKA